MKNKRQLVIKEFVKNNPKPKVFGRFFLSFYFPDFLSSGIYIHSPFFKKNLAKKIKNIFCLACKGFKKIEFIYIEIFEGVAKRKG